MKSTQKLVIVRGGSVQKARALWETPGAETSTPEVIEDGTDLPKGFWRKYLSQPLEVDSPVSFSLIELINKSEQIS